jgi:hypothetical protein
MLNFRKATFGCLFLGSLVLLCAAALQTPLAAPGRGQSGASSGALAGFAESASSRVDSFISSISAEIPDQVKAFPHQASVFLRKNATTARLQFEGMKNSVTAHLRLSGWFGPSGPNWIQSGAQTASQAGGNKARTLARKVPVVNSAMDATRERVNAVTQSVTNSSLGF